MDEKIATFQSTFNNKAATNIGGLNDYGKKIL